MSERIYRRGKDDLPSVTTVIGVLDKPALLYWMLAHPNHKELSAEARRVGTAVHEYIRCDLEPAPLPAFDAAVDVEVATAIRAWQKFRAEHEVDVARGWLERALIGDGYAGTCDFIGQVDGQWVICDWKCATGLYEDVRLQTAAYLFAAVAQEDVRAAVADAGVIGSLTRAALRLDKTTGDYEFRAYDSATEADDYTAFRACLALYNWRREAKRLNRAAKKEREETNDAE